MKKLLSTILLATIVVAGFSQDNAKKKEKKTELYGYIIDTFTKAAVPQDSLKVFVLDTDSVLVDTANVYGYRTYMGFDKTYWEAKVPARPGKYIIKATHTDYETTYMDYEVKRIGRNRYFELPALRMHRIQRSNYDKDGGSLQEVVVKATKVKMVYKGDTIIYNADAFNVPEGSMLDGLIKQLPGVELKDNGEIFVNGKKIENLTLNGADFFKGKNKMMLENLPYYTVKNVQVYDKQTPKSKFEGHDVEQKEYTMDVVLKKEYRVGGTVYVEGGYGTDKRYKGKGFGLRYSDHSRAVLFGGSNNLNEYIDYDREGNERGRTEASGDRKVHQVGGLWTLNSAEERATNTLEYNLKWEDNHQERNTQSENFLSGASTFGQSENVNNSRPFSMNVRNNFQLQKPFFVYSWLNFDYSHSHYDSEGFSLTARDVLFGDKINLSRSLSQSRSDRMSLNLSNNIEFKMPWGDMLEFDFGGYVSRYWNAHSFSQNHYTFYNTGTIDQRNQFNDSPSKSYSFNGTVGYRIALTEDLYLTPSVGTTFDWNNNDNRLYRLDWLGPDWAVDGPNALGSLPTDDVLQQVLDRPNSSEEGQRVNAQMLRLGINFSKQMEGRYFFIYGYFAESFRRNHMTYENDQVQAAVQKNYNLPQMYFNFQYSFDNWHKTISAYAQCYHNMPSIRQLVDIKSTANPLNISLGNPDLEPMTYWTFNASYRSRKDSTDQQLNISLNGNVQRNAFANAYTYDATTGIYTSWTENINGNWNLSGSIDFSRALGKKKFWHIGGNLGSSITQSTDMSAIAGMSEPQRNRVTSTRLNFSPNVRYQKDKLTFTLLAGGSWQHFHRSIAVDGLAVDTYDFNYGFNANYQLPWHFTIDTDLQMHSRRGYAEADMNDNRLYWDATLTKSWKQGRWVAKVKGYDLLGKVSQWQYYVNSNGRYETWTNNMRRYVMFSLAYRFSLTPKKQ